MKAQIMLGTLLLLSGCTFARQATQDYQTGRTAPLEAGEVSPKEQAQNILAPVQALPYGNTAYPILVTILGGVFTWNRGRKKRKEMKGETTDPITGVLGNSAGLELIVQNIANVLTGLMDVGPSGSGLKRGWKVGISTAGALLTTALMIPEVHNLLLKPEVLGSISGLAALFAGLEKSAQRIIPTVEQTPTPSP